MVLYAVDSAMGWDSIEAELRLFLIGAVVLPYIAMFGTLAFLRSLRKKRLGKTNRGG